MFNVWTAYQEAKARIAAGKATVVDEAFVALWSIYQEQKTELTKATHKISLLESTNTEFNKQEKFTEALAVLNKARYTH